MANLFIIWEIFKKPHWQWVYSFLNHFQKNSNLLPSPFKPVQNLVFKKAISRPKDKYTANGNCKMAESNFFFFMFWCFFFHFALSHGAYRFAKFSGDIIYSHLILVITGPTWNVKVYFSQNDEPKNFGGAKWSHKFVKHETRDCWKDLPSTYSIKTFYIICVHSINLSRTYT